MLPPLALYVHIPWCVRKCPYCDFNSHEARGDVPEDAYVDALLADLEFALPGVWGRKVVTVFLGGGTPSLFSAAAIDRLLAGIRARIPLLPDAEITLEANPGTFERQKFAGYFAAGVNRLSLGIQSFDDAHLKSLGRVHDADEARRAAEAALMIFGNVNFDLMYALPHQTVAGACADLAAALKFAPPHLSFYHLTLEPNTLFHRHPPPLPDEDTAADIEDAVHATLAGAGYRHYETSAYAKPDRACRHNMNYWQFGDYLGIGAGAHSKLSYSGPHRAPGALEAAAAVSRAHRRSAPAAGGSHRRAQRYRLRIHAERAAARATAFRPRCSPSAPAIRCRWSRGRCEIATRKGLLDPDPTVLRPTELGRRFLNDLQELFLVTPRRARAAPLVHIEATGVER